MGGAYTAVAEGIDGATSNAASPGVREPFSFGWVDYDVDLDVSLPGEYLSTDFDNRGPQQDARLQSTVDGFFYLHGGAQLQLGELGVSATAELFQYTVNPATGGTGVSLEYGRYHALVGYGLFDNQLVIGSGLRIVTLQVSGTGGAAGHSGTLLTLDGAGPEVGAILKPDGLPFRLGATLRSEVGATVAGVAGQVGGLFGAGGGQPSGPVVVQDGFILPAKATLPWELETGFAFQLGPRPLNPAWLNPYDMESPVRDRIQEARARRELDYAHELDESPPEERSARERGQAAHEAAIRRIEDQELDAESQRLRATRVARNANWPRERITVFGSLLITGKSTRAVSLEGFATQTMQAVGESISVTPRVGIESEPIHDLLVGRVGSYLEPSRFSDGTARQHFTIGGDLKLLPFSPWGIFGDQVWRLTVAADLAPRYQNFGIGLGAWH
jgi:hypothetical protein